MKNAKKIFYALSVYCGTIIGVGLFGLPYVAAKAGFLIILIYFGVLGVISIISALVYGEIASKTPGQHRLPGYAGIYLGNGYKWIVSVNNTLGISGALLAYVLIGGNFLANLCMPFWGGNKLTYSILFFLFGVTIIFFSNKTVAMTELTMLIVFFIVVFLLYFSNFKYINIGNLTKIDFRYLFLPYGVVLFSIFGNTIIPEVHDLLSGKSRKYLNRVLIAGFSISIATYIIFIISVLGVTGAATTPDALTGIKNFTGNKNILIFFLFGFLTTFTSFITLGLTLKKIFWFDLKMPHFLSWFIAIIIPVIFYLLGINDFIFIITLIGAIALGMDIIITFLIYLKTKENNLIKYNLKLSKNIVFLIILMFVIGLILQFTALPA